jgi:hypothetical protein
MRKKQAVKPFLPVQTMEPALNNRPMRPVNARPVLRVRKILPDFSFLSGNGLVPCAPTRFLLEA